MLSMTDSVYNPTPVIELFGSEEESFYQLGIRDRESVEISLHHIKSLISTKWNTINKQIHGIAAELVDKVSYHSNHHERLLQAYSDGLQVKKADIKFALMIPEICSFIGSNTPDLSRLGFGCSSFFSLNKHGEPVHHRVLDFPLKGTYDQFERVQLSHFKNKNKVINFSSVGLPFSGLTSMNESGLTLGIHQKFTDHFNVHGESIFYLAHELIHQCHNIDDVKNFLMKHQTITNWNFNCLDRDGNVLSADLCGNKVTFLEHDLEDGPIYFCNELLDQDLKQADFIPSGINNYNDKRIDSAYSKLKKLALYDMDDPGMLKYLSTPTKKKKFHIDPITLSSVSSVLFNPLQESCYHVYGESPKIHVGKTEKYSEVFDTYQRTLIETKALKNNVITKEALAHLSLAQSHFDLNQISECYHELQMSIEKNRGTPYEAISKFYFLVVQYIYEEHLNVLSHLQDDILEFYDDLPTYLQEVAIIIDQRLSILCSTKQVLTANISNENLKKRYRFESKKGKLAHQIFKKSTFIHIDIFDVIFL